MVLLFYEKENSMAKDNRTELRKYLDRHNKFSQEVLDAFDDFAFWLERDAKDVDETEFTRFYLLIEKYLACNPDKLHEAELEKLELYKKDN